MRGHVGQSIIEGTLRVFVSSSNNVSLLLQPRAILGDCLESRWEYFYAHYEHETYYVHLHHAPGSVNIALVPQGTSCNSIQL